MKGVTGTMGRLSGGPGWPRQGLDGPATVDSRFVHLAEIEAATSDCAVTALTHVTRLKTSKRSRCFSFSTVFTLRLCTGVQLHKDNGNVLSHLVLS